MIEPAACSQFFLGGFPTTTSTNSSFLCHSRYATLHDNVLKAPIYSAEKLESQNLNGTITRTDDFRPDPALQIGARAELEDFKGSGFDRGHMAPAADFSTDPIWMSESFLLSNMVAQNHTMNSGIWERLETATRNCAQALGAVYVVTGSIFDTMTTTIGVHQVVVPTHLFKVIVDPSTLNSRAYIMPNTAITGAFAVWQMSIDAIEARTGLDLFPNAALPEADLGTLCAANFN